MAVMEISVVPLGQGPSISSYVADCIRILKKEKVPYELTAMGTNIQGNLKDLIKLALQMHQLPFKKGALRVGKLRAHRAELPGDE
ncbi:MAG: MTH1187 family thiamine-binding protein [Desulfobacterales bacterium]|nr:MTH1187 family thiamine-binding protein [Desulfobacterales bacterium]